MAALLWSGGCSFFFSMFKWFFSASGANCNGWDRFPTFGLKALKWTWQYDWSLTYIGVGAAVSHFNICHMSVVLYMLSMSDQGFGSLKEQW